MTLLGAILAGGRNTRYGAHKALAEVGGEPIIERVRRALEGVSERVVLLANEPEVYAPLGLDMRPDARAGLGPLGGIHAALLWARELETEGALAVACDMPFVPVELLRWLAAAGHGEPGGAPPDVVVPESRSRRGLEPLCAFYSVRCLAAIEARADAGDRRMVGFFDDVTVQTLPLERVRRLGDPEVLFMNVTTPAERERAEALAAGMER
ncbi:MAG TPA: molybdenum cofactor guanylyltransferase [Longimicrobiales bacterium]|nr:molybdenum cofactor guanylyltransferase [Longimicrobiales bacterium]